MNIEVWEQVTAIAVTIGLVAGNFFLFTPWRNGHDPLQAISVVAQISPY